MNIIIVSNFPADLDGKSYGRFTYLAEMLSEQGHNVELITSTFMHSLKKQREIVSGIFKSKITLIYEPGYKKNVCLERFKSHYIWGNNVYKYLKSLNIKPDIIYCAIPSMTVSVKCAKYCKKNNIKYVIDIQDLWPEAFSMIIRNKILQPLFKPFEWYVNKAYKAANIIIAVSQTYVDRAIKVNKKFNKSLYVFLGNDGQLFDIGKAEYKILKNDREIQIGYVGSMGDSYDIKCIISAISIVQESGFVNKDIRFVLCGTGEKHKEFEDYANEKNINANFLGYKPYKEMVGILCSCDIVVNPIVKGSAASIINKVGDYALSGRPVINTQECQEYRNLIDEYQCGINCECENAEDVANAIIKLCLDENLREKMGKNHRKLGNERFDRRKTYQKIIDSILN